MKKLFFAMLFACSFLMVGTSNATIHGTIKTTIQRASNFCISAGSGCTITITITFLSESQLSATFDKFGSEEDGQTIDGFSFTVKDNGVDVQYTVPTQTLHWDTKSNSFILSYTQA